MFVLGKSTGELKTELLNMIGIEYDWLSISRQILCKFISSLSIRDINNSYVCGIQKRDETVTDNINDSRLL